MGNVPNLRFPEFSGKWKKCTLGDITINFNLRNKEKIELPMYSVTNNRGFIPQSEQFEDRDMVGEDIKAYKIIHNKDFAYNPARINVGSIAKYNGSKPCMISSLYVCFKAANGIDEDWLMHLLRSPKIQYYYNINGEGGVRIYLFYPNFARIRTSFPTIAEQRKIANLLSLLDARITTQNKIIEDLKKLKSAISHILFSSKGAIHLSEIANVVMGQSPSSNAYNDQGLGMPLVQGNLDISNGKTTPRLYTAEFNQTTEKGNIILTVRAPVGEVAKATQKVCLGRGVCAIIPHEENMSDFIYQYLTFYKFMWRRYEQGSTFTSINGSDVRNIFCPKVRNVSILTLLDIKINIEEREVKQYQSQKQYMLYQMFI